MMGRMPRPPRPLDPRRSEKLLRVAAAAFAADGLEGASLNDILNRAGMAKSSFYHRFSDKAALHDWVTTTMAGAVRAAIRPPDLGTLSGESFRPAVTDMLERFQLLAASRPDLMALGMMFHNSADAPDERAIARVRVSAMTWIVDALKIGRGLGVIRDDLPTELMSSWAVASLTAIDQWVLTASVDMDERSEVSTRALDALWMLLAPAA